MTGPTRAQPSRKVKRTRYILALVFVLIAFAAYWISRERPVGTEAAAETCAAMPPEIAGALAAADDCLLFHKSLTQSLAITEAGGITRWINTKTGTTGTTKLGATEMRGDVACRRAEITIERTGDTKSASILACLREGRWTLER